MIHLNFFNKDFLKYFFNNFLLLFILKLIDLELICLQWTR